jgi:hypothetical protein
MGMMCAQPPSIILQPYGGDHVAVLSFQSQDFL